MPIKRLMTTTMKRIERGKITRVPLMFLKAARDPFLGLKEQATHEANMKAEVGAIHNAMVDRLRQDQQRKKLAGAADDNFTVCFETGEQATAFLRALGYREFNECFIDGLILAELLKIELPQAKAKIKPLKSTHPASMTRLVTNWKDPTK